MKSVLCYVISICIFSIIVGIGNTNLDISMSTAIKQFSEIYLFGDFETNMLIFEILKIIVLQGLLLYFFSLVHSFLVQFRISQSVVFVIYTGILIIMAGMTLGFFGEIIKPFSLFSIAGSVYGYGMKFICRLGILVLIDILLLLLNFKVFENKDIMLPKGNKQYQNE